jgi:hypothetical protein
MVADNRERDRQWAERDRQWDNRWTDIAEAIARLAHVAEIHEQRIERLEE